MLSLNPSLSGIRSAMHFVLLELWGVVPPTPETILHTLLVGPGILQTESQSLWLHLPWIRAEEQNVRLGGLEQEGLLSPPPRSLRSLRLSSNPTENFLCDRL